ncbi:MAG: sugar phosphate isomerase/epimerase [Synergistaceae bacterium]|nr:sugar phosphate isomerase/epimerase [Synergistaceae bacterium]
MKIGFVSAILDGSSFEETIEVASKYGFSCVEIACWPAGRTERRYAGVSHINVDGLTDERAAAIRALCEKRGISISALAFYSNPMDSDAERRTSAVLHLEKVMRASAKLGVNMVTTFVGRDQRRNIDENLELFRDIWPPIIAKAEKLGVRIAVENCPVLFGPDQWPGGQNMFTTPKIWRKLFDIIPSRNFGINYDPSHFVWQMMDYLLPLYEFRHRIFHVHLKDARLYPDRLRDAGITAYPLEFMSHKLPGLGDVNWGAFVSALNDIGYDGPACIEVEDRAYEGSRERILQSLRLSKRYLSQFIEY